MLVYIYCYIASCTPAQPIAGISLGRTWTSGSCRKHTRQGDVWSIDVDPFRGMQPKTEKRRKQTGPFVPVPLCALSIWRHLLSIVLSPPTHPSRYQLSWQVKLRANLEIKAKRSRVVLIALWPSDDEDAISDIAQRKIVKEEEDLSCGACQARVDGVAEEALLDGELDGGNSSIRFGGEAGRCKWAVRIDGR
jgi:hypothetical protein